MVWMHEKCLHVHWKSCEKPMLVMANPKRENKLSKFFLRLIITTMDFVGTLWIIGVDPMLLAPAVQKLDNAIHWISQYSQNNTIIMVSLILICSIVIYPVDSTIWRLHNWWLGFLGRLWEWNTRQDKSQHVK